ncbi:DUF6473 family protein [Roseovarius salis]|uniref:DUF6473 family protein n=1 Tax=Roseovarius salis TaxID=3376063 RepID=UPI0037C8179D
MTSAETGQSVPDFDQCSYDGSRLIFRGPRKPLDGDFIACLGGTDTVGRFIPAPFPDLLEQATGITCVNFGWPNAGIDVFANDTALMDCAARARLTVLQVPCAVNMSNMYYRVHPRRNDRFLRATDALHALFPEVDFTEFSFTRHLLGHLRDVSPERFAYVRRELSAVWTQGMRRLIKGMGNPLVLLWLSARSPDAGIDRPGIHADPALVSRDMLESLRAEVHAIVELNLGEEARGADIGPARSPQERRAARKLLGPGAHRAAAEALSPVATAALAQ